jgi:hypothetical protein
MRLWTFWGLPFQLAFTLLNHHRSQLLYLFYRFGAAHFDFNFHS